MTPAQYQRLAPLFQLAMGVPINQRADLARQLCAGDADLLTELLALLRAAEQPIDSLDKPFGLAIDLPRPADSPTLRHLVIDRFRIVRSLGRGGMGKVFQAVDRQTGATVAIKLIQTRGAFAEDQRMRFLREARSVGALRHPSIVEVYDIGQVQGHLYLVMEYLEGRSLRALINDGGLPDFKAIAKILSQVANALAFAHSKGVIHGDIKPDNIMVLNDGSAKLVDFGVAQQVGLPSSLAQAGGTPLYMAPERLDPRTPAATAAADIWATGVTLFECVTRKIPFKTRDEILASRQPRITWNSPLAEPVNSLIARTLVKNPGERLQNASQLCSELESLCAASESLPGSPSPAISSKASGQQDSQESYELPDLGFRNQPEGKLETKTATFVWAKMRVRFLAWRDLGLAKAWNRVPPRLGFGLFVLVPLFLANPMFRGLAVLVLLTPIAVCVLLAAVCSLLAAICSLINALKRLPLCRNCHLAMSRTSSWTRFAKDKAEVTFGQSDSMAALKHGLWQEAAKLLSIHGRECVSEYANSLIAATLFRLEFFECDTCREHAARLTTEDKVGESWKQREQYYEAYWQGSKDGDSLRRDGSRVFKHVKRIIAEAGRIRVKSKWVLMPVSGCIVLAVMLGFTSYTSAMNGRLLFRRLMKERQVCYAYPKAHGRFGFVELDGEKETQEFLRDFECELRLNDFSDCQMYCKAK